MSVNYLDKYLDIAPFSHALWRSLEAKALDKTKRLIKYRRPILDLGCGFGEFSGVFFKSSIEVGVDISPADLLKADRFKKYRHLYVEDARNLSFTDSSFSTVISISVLEHIPQVNQAIKESYRVLKPGGYFIITVPTRELNNYLFYPYWLNRVFRHVNLWPVIKWERLLTQTGFKLILSQTFISQTVARIWELFLITALPSQLFRWLTGHRLIWRLNWKKHLLNRLFGYLIHQKSDSGCNLILVAQKPF